MSTRPSTLPVTGLASVRNARTRVYAPGADPKFRADPTSSSFRLIRVFPTPGGTAHRDGADRLWRHDVLDRLQTPLTRRPE